MILLLILFAAIIVVSTGIAVIPAALRVHNLQHWFHLALVVLVSACPCALILSTPVATFCALTRATTSGLLVKVGDYLETLSKINITAFDKTGTLTRGEFVVTHFQSLSGFISFNRLLYWVSSIESKSSHPMATAEDHIQSNQSLKLWRIIKISLEKASTGELMEEIFTLEAEKFRREPMGQGGIRAELDLLKKANSSKQPTPWKSNI